MSAEVNARILIDDDEDDDDREAFVQPGVMDAHLLAQSSTCGQKCSIGPIAIFLLVAVVGAASFHKGKTTEHIAAGITPALARITLAANTSADPCNDLWQFACGTFETNAANGASTLGNFQHGINARLIAHLAVSTSDAAQYYNNCITSDNVSSMVSILELLQGGETVNDVAVGAIQLDGKTARLTMAVAFGDADFDDYETIGVPSVNECERTLLEFAELVSGVNVRTLAVFGKGADMCASLNRTNLTKLVEWPLPVNPTDCLLETSRVWPAEIANIFLAMFPEVGSNAVQTAASDMLAEIKVVFVEQLTSAKFDALASKIGDVNIRLQYTAMADEPVTLHGPEAFALDYTRINVQRAQASMQASAPPAWAMEASAVNAYYSPVHNTISVTPAMLLFASGGGGNHALDHGKLGFVLAHELAHAIDNTGVKHNAWGKAVTILPDVYNRAVYEGGVQCLQSEFATDGKTTGEDIADHIAIQAMKLVMNRHVPTASSRICAPVCTEITSMMLFYMNFAETWCSASDTVRNEGDVHSPGKVRVKHAFITSHAAEVFGCPAVDQNTCVIAGF